MANDKDQVQPGLDNVKHIIAVASGKGGVGKSTVSVNLAVALSAAGNKVGLLDADIYGPSQPGMLGSHGDQPNVGQGYLHPIDKHGVKFVSMGLLTDEDSPVIWRAPIAMKMIHQFLGGVLWGELDYLVIDLPPGTGDVQLTLAQQAQLSGAVIVTTPQQVALGVVRKGIRMFEQVKVPIIGIVENMSGFVCKHCGEETEIFNKGGGKAMADKFGVPFLGSLPLDPEIMMSGESGKPVLSKSSESHAAKAILEIASQTMANLDRIVDEEGAETAKEYAVDEDGNLAVTWGDGSKATFSPYHLRVNCPCANCVDEDTGKRTLDPKQVALDIKINGVNPVGRYGLAITFSDGHNTGIYSFEHLKKLEEKSDAGEKDKSQFSV